MSRTRTQSQNYYSPHRSGIVQLLQVLCRAGALWPFMHPFVLGKSRDPAQNNAAGICKQGFVHKCPTGITVLVTLPLYLSLRLIRVSATPARLPAGAHSFCARACQSIELLMHNHARSQPRNANSTS